MEFILAVLTDTRESLFGTGEYVYSWIQAVVAAGATLFSAYGSYKQGRDAQKNASNAAADMRWNANKIREQGAMEGKEIKRQVNRTMNDAAALQAASGFASSDPTDLRQLAEISGAGKWNEIAAMYEAEMRAQGEMRASKNLRATGQAQKRAGIYSAGSTLISGASQFGDAFSSVSSAWNTRNTNSANFVGPPRRGGGN